MSAGWERGEEILPGAKQAIEEAKNDSLSFNLSLVEASSGPVTRYDFPYSGNVLEVIANLTWQNRASDIIGIAGVLHPNVLAVISRFQLPIASLVQMNEAPSHNVRYMTASTSTLTDSILTFLEETCPKKIGIVTELKQPYWMVSSELSTKTNISLNIQIVDQHQKSLSGIATRVLESNVHIILLSVDPSTAIQMLCEAYTRGLTWPKYVWILHSYRLDDLLQSSDSNEGCSAEKILEGIFIFQLTEEGSYFSSETKQYKMGNVTNGFNPYAAILHDSVRALISAADNRSFAHLLNPDCSSIYIYHNLNETAHLIGIFDGISRTLTNLSEITFIEYNLPAVKKEPPLVHYLVLPILCFLFNTILLILYIVF